MNVPGETEYRTKGVTYCPTATARSSRAKPVAVIGGRQLGRRGGHRPRRRGGPRDLLEFDSKLRADAVLVKKLESLPTKIIVNAQTTEVNGDGQKVIGLTYRIASPATCIRWLAGIFVQIGLLPNTQWLKGTVELSSRGEIIVDDHGALRCRACLPPVT